MRSDKVLGIERLQTIGHVLEIVQQDNMDALEDARAVVSVNRTARAEGSDMEIDMALGEIVGREAAQRAFWALADAVNGMAHEYGEGDIVFPSLYSQRDRISREHMFAVELEALKGQAS